MKWMALVYHTLTTTMLIPTSGAKAEANQAWSGSDTESQHELFHSCSFEVGLPQVFVMAEGDWTE